MTSPGTLAAMWDRNLRLYSDVEAVVSGDRRLTFGQLGERALRLAASLRGFGVAPRDRVGMLATNCPEWFDFYAACEMSGFHALTVNFRLTAGEIAFILSDAAPKVVIFEAQYAGLLDSIRGELSGIERWICIGDDIPEWADPFEAVIDASAPEKPIVAPQPNDPAHLIYTSGTTGKPKGVVRNQQAGFALAAACATSMQFRINGRGLVLMPLFHVGAQSMASGQHWAGGTVVLQNGFEPAEIAQTIADERITMTHMTPDMLRRFIDAIEGTSPDFSSLETLCYAAAPMPLPLLERCTAVFGPVLYDCYGSTETGNVSVLQSHWHQLDGDEEARARMASVGQETNFSRLSVQDDAGNQLPPGEPGELCIQAQGMMDGYWNRSDSTVAAFRNGWYLSGDVARMDENGFVTLVDRKKDMIVSGGENVYCREVEEAIASHDAVADVAVIGIPSDAWGEEVCAIVVPVPGASITLEELTDHTRAIIAAYKRPRSLYLIDELPRLNTGKVDKKALRSDFPREEADHEI